MTSLLGFKQSTKARRGFSVILQIDLESIAIYIGEVKGSSKAAKNVYAQIMDAVDLLCEMPDLGNLITRNRHSHSLTITSECE